MTSEKEEAGDDIVVEKNLGRKDGKERSANNRAGENERKLNIVEPSNGIIETYILVRGVSLRKEAFGKPPIQNFIKKGGMLFGS